MLTDAELRAVVALLGHGDARVRVRARDVLYAEYARVLAAQDYGAYRAFCGRVWALDHTALVALLVVRAGAVDCGGGLI